MIIVKKVIAMMKEKENQKKILSIVGFLVIIGIIIYIPYSLAAVEPVKSVKIYSENTDYKQKDQGAFEITKSGKWVAKGEAEVTFDVETIKKIDSKHADVLLVLDVSGSMVGGKLDAVKRDSKDLIDNLFLNSENKVGLITFSDNSTILSQITVPILLLNVEPVSIRTLYFCAISTHLLCKTLAPSLDKSNISS